MISSVETPSAPGTRWLNARPLLVEEIWESELVCCEEVASFYPSSNPAKIKNEHSFRSLLARDEGNNASTFKGKKTFVPLSFPLFYLKVFSFLSSDQFWSHNRQSIGSLFYNYHRFMDDNQHCVKWVRLLVERDQESCRVTRQSWITSAHALDFRAEKWFWGVCMFDFRFSWRKSWVKF